VAVVFVAGSHTDVGKTYVACALIMAARARGLMVEALKPVVSGFDPADWAHSDPGRLLTALGEPHAEQALQAMSPWRYRAPLAPPMAAMLEGRRTSLLEVAEFCHDRMAASRADLLVIEGVGGVMSPLADDATGLDLVTALGAPVVLVGGSYLGAISHTLTAVEVLQGRGADVRAIIVSESVEADGPDFGETLASLGRFAGPTVAAARRGEALWAQAALDGVLSDAGAG